MNIALPTLAMKGFAEIKLKMRGMREALQDTVCKAGVSEIAKPRCMILTFTEGRVLRRSLNWSLDLQVRVKSSAVRKLTTQEIKFCILDVVTTWDSLCILLLGLVFLRLCLSQSRLLLRRALLAEHCVIETCSLFCYRSNVH